MALSHPKRTEILGYLRQRDGADAAELIEALDLPASRVEYHLAVLQSADLIAHVDPTSSGAFDRYVTTPSTGG